MEKSYSKIRAILCSALLVVILISLFMPVVSFNSADKFDESEAGEIKLGWYNKAINGADLEHAGKINVSLISIIFSSGKDIDTLTELYKLGELKKAEEPDKTELEGKIAVQNNNKSVKQAELAAKIAANQPIVNEKEQAIASKEQELTAANARLEELQLDLVNNYDEWWKLYSETIPKIAGEIDALEKEITALESDYVNINSAIASIDKTIDEELQPQLDAVNAVIAELQAEIDGIMNGLSEKEDVRIQNKLRKKSFLKKVALRCAMYNVNKESSYLTFGLVVTLIALAVLVLDIVLKVRKLVSMNFKFTDCVVKALTDIRLPIVAFILHMFTVQHFVAKSFGIVNLGSGIIIGLIAIVLFALELAVVPVLKAKEEGGDKYKKTVIKQSITVGVLLLTVIISILGMRISALMINDMQRHYPDFLNRCAKILTKYDSREVVDKVTESMSIGITMIAFVPIIAYSALGYMLARTAAAEKVRTKKSRRPKTPLGTFYIGFIFVAVAYVLSLMLFTVKDSTKRYEMYDNCQMSVVFAEYKEEIDAESIKEKGRQHDSITRDELLVELDIMEESLDALRSEYKDTSDKQMKSEIKSEISDLKLEIKAAEAEVDRIESNKQSNLVIMIVLATIAIAAEIVFKMTKFEAERIAASGNEN